MGNEQSQQIKYGDKLENDVEVTWEKVAGQSGSFPGRDGHCSSVVNDKLYVFGGVVQPHGKGHESEVSESNDLLVFDTEKNEWHREDVLGVIPPPRSSATMATVDNKLYMFGGLSREVGWFNTLSMFDTETSTWSEVTTQGTGPNPRDKLASAVIEKNIYIFGGFGPQGTEQDQLEDLSEDDDEDDEGAQFGWFNDLFIFNTETKTWSSPMQMNLGCPSPRAAHDMCAVDKYLVIFGGRDAKCRQNDLHIFDTESRKWQTDVNIQGRQPEPRSFHTVTAVGDRVVVTGGRGTSNQHFSDFHIFDAANRQWLQPNVMGAIPPARGIHTVNVVGDKLLIYGGSGNFSEETLQCMTYYNDTYILNTAGVLSGKATSTDIVLENEENIPSKANVSNTNSKEEGLAVANGTAKNTETS